MSVLEVRNNFIRKRVTNSFAYNTFYFFSEAENLTPCMILSSRQKFVDNLTLDLSRNFRSMNVMFVEFCAIFLFPPFFNVSLTLHVRTQEHMERADHEDDRYKTSSTGMGLK